MTTKTVTKRISLLGLICALPAAGCAAFLSHAAFTLNNEALAAVFTLVGVAICYGGTRIR